MTLKSKFLIDGVLLKFNIKSEKNSSRAAKLFQTVEKFHVLKIYLQFAEDT